MKKWLLVKQARAAMEMTQTELGDLIGVDLQEISKWERNVITIPIPRIHQLKDYYEQHTGDVKLFSEPIKYVMSKENLKKTKKGGSK